MRDGAFNEDGSSPSSVGQPIISMRYIICDVEIKAGAKESLLGPVYMGENSRQYAGSNPLCTRLHGEPALCGSKCRSIFRTLFRLGTLGVKSGVFSNSSMMHCARDSFIQDGCCFGLLPLNNRRNNNPHKHMGRPKRIGYNCPEFGSLQVSISNKNYIPFRYREGCK
ncbi:hypothetical protein TNCV_2822101 [Trichonephila clavipes]|uniref:Uncharacterized protein n=1 Tax=Trichonephila clavipes TaxID=2585209 RepID=A0A8X6WGK6_TRICX|nr:hypothetical protein TNCV_2822101 [Trichonephila clavipes]